MPSIGVGDRARRRIETSSSRGRRRGAVGREGEHLCSLHYSVALKTALCSCAAARCLITPELEPLVAQELKSIQESIMEAFDVRLDGSKTTTKRRMQDLAS